MKTLLVTILALVLGACGGKAEGAGQPEPSGTRNLLSDLTLDDGERWSTDDHTRTSAETMRATVQSATEDLSVDATRTLGERLQSQLGELVAGCTMQGPAHDALHVYLSVLMPRVHTMTTGEASEAVRAREEVAEILRQFPRYFE